MKEHGSVEARTEAALNSSLGLLQPSESDRLQEHLRSGCAECEAEVSSFAEVAGALGMGANAVAPPPQLRAQLLRAVKKHSASQEAEMQAWRIVRTASLPWLPTRRDGIWEKSLMHDQVRNRSARLIKMNPGAEIPCHRHHGTEESLVLEGTGELGDFVFGPGDYHRARSGSLHSSYASKEGCVFLLFSGTQNEFGLQGLEQSSSEHFTTVRSRSATWQPKRSGLDVQTLFSDSESAVEATALQRLAAGSVLTESEFSVSEAYILEGKACLGSVELSAGDYLQKIQTNQKSELHSEHGCTILTRSVSL
jgi:quercetin dioxygenase-like cupin family protein